MYNRYIPQSDGSFRKNRMPENGKPQKQSPQPNRGMNTQQSPPPCPPAKNQQPKPRTPVRHQSAESFLRQLLPQGLDTGDLLIAVLLLLMAGDCQEDKNTSLLTLALYLFM